MNLLRDKHTAKFYVSIIVLILMTLITNIAQAQKQFTTISKNINPEAASLYHDLSPQGDSLYLKSESIFYKVTFLNSLDRKVYNFNPPVLEGKISLHDIIVGDYTVLVYKKDRIIVFHISRLLEINIPTEMIASKSISVSQNLPIISPMISQVKVKERARSKRISNGFTIDENFEVGLKELKVSVNDEKFNKLPTINASKLIAYNLTNSDRKNMQSREDYRKNNLRPNGKPY